MPVSVGVLTAKLTLDTADFSRGATKAATDAKGLGQAISGINFRQVGLEIAAAGAVLTGAFGGALVMAVKAASDLNESMTKSAVVFGESAKAVQEWASTAATSMGQSSQLALESAATFGNLFTTMGLGQEAAAAMSQDMVQLASDMASFNNASPEDMLIKLRAGLVGEIEPLRSVGIAMNAASVEAKAMEMGLGATKDQISEADKVLARYALILEQSTNAQGDFARTADGVANQTRIAKAQLDDLAASFGQALLPAVAQGLSLFNQLLGLLARMPDEFKKMAVAVALVTTAVGLAFVAIGTIVAILGGPLTIAIGAIIAILAALTAAVALGWERILKIFDGGVGGIRISFKQVATILGAGADAFAILVRVALSAFDMIVTAARVMVAGVSGAFAALKNSLAPILMGIVTNNLGLFAGGLMTLKEITVNTLGNVKEQFKGLSSRIGQDVEDIGNHFTGKFKGAFEKATESVGGAVRKIGTDLNKLKDGLNQAGEAAKKHGQAHADAAKQAEKVAAAWAKVGEIAAKMDLESRKAMEEMMLAEKAFAKNHYDIMELRADTTAMFLDAEGKEWKKHAELIEDAEHQFAQAIIDGIKKRGIAIKEEEQIAKELLKTWNEAFTNLLGGWADYGNQVMKVLNGMNSKIPSSLGGLLEKITGLFTSSTEEAQKWASRITTVINGVATFMQSRHQGKAAGVLGGAMAGMQIGSLFGPIGAGIGAGVGAIAGLFGSGKSAEQKAAEERQKKQMAMDMEKAAIDIQGAAMDVMKKALETFKHLADHVDVPKKAIQSFFKTLEKVTKEFLQLAAKFAKDNLEAAKMFAETMGPVVDLMGGALQAFDAIRFYTAIPERAIKDMASDLGKAAEAMGAVALAVEDHIEKKAKRFSDRVLPVIELIASAFEAFKSLAEYKGIATAVFTEFFIDVQTATNMMGELADDMSRNFLNKAKTYAERIAVIVQAIGTSVAALTSLRTYEAVPQKAFEALQHDVLAAFAMIDSLVVAAEMYLDRAITFEDLVRRIVGALDSGVSMIRSVSGGMSGGGLDAIRMAPSGAGGGGTAGRGGQTVIIERLEYSGMNPQAQRVIDSVQGLFGQAGMPLTARAY